MAVAMHTSCMHNDDDGDGDGDDDEWRCTLEA